VLLAAWSLGMGIAWPLLRGYARLLSDPAAGSRGARVATLALGGPALLALLLFAVPLPHHTRVQGVVALPEQAVLRAGADGFIDAVLAAPGATLQPGMPVLRSDSIELRARHRVQQASVDETQARLDAAWASQPALAGQLEEALKREQAALARLATELARLQLDAGIGGRLLLHQPDDLPGRFVRQGEPVAYLVGAVTPIVRAVVAQGQVDDVRADTRSISVRLPQAFGQSLPAQLVRAVPQAASRLPSAALGQLGGGDISVDPRDDQGVTALETVFEFELQLPGQQAVQHLGSRAFVAFEHAPEPLGFRLVRAVRRQLLSQFEL
jgi:putative peptide zinc metalloprotease protein